MASGFGPADGVQDTIAATLDNAVDHARSQLERSQSRPSRTHCLECGEQIPEARRKASPGCQYCIECQSSHDKRFHDSYNRRGSKDSQLR